MKSLEISTRWIYLAQLVICMLFLYWFCNNSLLRPSPGNAHFKEFIIGGLLLIICYLNAFVLHPTLFQRNKAAYVMSSVISVLVALLVEFSWLYNDIMSCLLRSFTPTEAHAYYWNCVFYAFLRDLGLVSFTFLICELKSNRVQKNTTEILLMKTDNKIEVKDFSGNNILLNYKQIRFCEQERNQTKIYANEEDIFFRYGSLANIQNIVGNEYFLQINRNTLVARKYIERYSDGQLWLLDEKNPFEVSSKFKNQKEFQTLNQKSDNSQQNEEKSKKKAAPNNEKTKMLYQLIAKNPDIPAIKLSKMTGMSPSTINRNLKQLKDKGLIEYSGSKKTGGYRVKEVATKTPTSNKKVKKRESTQPL